MDGLDDAFWLVRILGILGWVAIGGRVLALARELDGRSEQGACSIDKLRCFVVRHER